MNDEVKFIDKQNKKELIKVTIWFFILKQQDLEQISEYPITCKRGIWDIFFQNITIIKNVGLHIGVTDLWHNLLFALFNLSTIINYFVILNLVMVY